MEAFFTALMGVLTVLLATARAAAQCQIVFAPGGADAGITRRGRLLGAMSAVVGVIYGQLIGADSWLMYAAWINTASSVLAAFTPAANAASRCQ
jgi:hypothetical protein